MMDALREKVARAAFRAGFEPDTDESVINGLWQWHKGQRRAYHSADQILAIPEIAEALALQASILPTLDLAPRSQDKS